MRYGDFGRFVDGFSGNHDRLALCARPFIRVERVTYGQLQAKAYQVARYLESLGVTAGDRVMVVAANSPEWVELFLGTQLIGGILVPVDVRSSLDTVVNYAGQTKPKLSFRGKYILPELDKHHKTLVIEDLAELISSFPGKKPDHKLTGQEGSVIVFTSGTTAAPKGVLLTQKNILTNAEDSMSVIKVSPEWRFLSVLPLSHMYELTGGCLVALGSGASVYYLSKVTPSAIAESLQENRITTMLAIPQLLTLFLERIRRTADQQNQTGLLNAMFRAAAFTPFSLRRLLFYPVHKKLGGKLSLVVTGGAPVPADVARDWERLGVTTLEGYGLTETSPVLTLNRMNDRVIGSPGLVMPSVSLRIGEDNEIQAKGPSVFAGYYQNSQATKQAFTSDGWFRTGDTGRLAGNRLWVQGRLKFAVVLSSGLKVFPEDVEVVTEKLPVLKNCCVVGVKAAGGEEVQVIVISEASDAAITTAVSEANALLESHQHISRWRRWPDSEFPRTRLLKIDRNKVQKWANETTEEEVAAVSAKAEGDPLKDVIRLVAGRPLRHIAETERLSDIGFDSLRRLSLVSMIEERLNVMVPEEDITKRTTVGELRKLIAKADPAEPAKKRSAWQFNGLTRTTGNFLRDTLIRAILRIWVHIVAVEGRENFAKLTGPAIVIFNHCDDFDIPVLYRAIPREIRNNMATAMADDVILEHRLLGFIAKYFYAAFNFARKEPYLPSLTYVGKLVSQNRNVALSPEGTVSATGELQPFKEGIGLLAVELQVPVIVVKSFGLYGTVPLHSKWPKKHSRVAMRVSEPITFSKDTDYMQATKRLRKAMEDL